MAVECGTSGWPYGLLFILEPASVFLLSTFVALGLGVPGFGRFTADVLPPTALGPLLVGFLKFFAFVLLGFELLETEACEDNRATVIKHSSIKMLGKQTNNVYIYSIYIYTVYIYILKSNYMIIKFYKINIL